MSPEEEAADLKRVNAALLQEKADAVTVWHNEVRSSLKALTGEVAAIKINTNQMPQILANQETLGVRVRFLEDFKILIICAFLMLAFVIACGVVFYVEWRLKRG